MDLSKVDKTTQSFIGLSTTIGEFAIQLLDGAPSEIKVKYAGDLAQNDTSLITRTIITNILKEDLGNEVNIINALAILNQQGVTYNIEKQKKHSGFSSYIELELVNDQDKIKIGATVFAGFGPRIVRINDYSLDFKPNQYQLVTCHKDKPGIVGQTGNLLGSHGINIASMTLGRYDAGGDALMILSIDQQASEEVIKILNETSGFNKIISTKLTI